MRQSSGVYKLAFIGGGINSIAGYPHLLASQLDNKFKVVAGAFSTQQEINKQTGKAWEIDNIYDSWQDMVQKEKNNIDAVVILTPTPLHYEMITKLLDLNIPVICEKPLVSSVEEIKRLENKYDLDKYFLVVINNYSGYPMLRELKYKIKNGELGDILHIRLKMSQESFLKPPRNIKYPQKWRLKDEFIPTICLDLGTHLHHLSYFLLQKEPLSLIANYESFSNYNIIDNVNIMFKCEDNLDGNMWISKVALGNRNGLQIEVFGKEASALWQQENPEKLQISNLKGETITIDRGSNVKIANESLYNRMTPGHPSGFIEGLANLYNDVAVKLDSFYDKIEIKDNYVYGFEHAKKGIIFFNNATLSDKLSKWIKIKDMINEV